MNKIRILGVLLCCVYLQFISAQASQGIPNKIIVQVNEQLTPYIAFELSKEQTLYGVCKFFNVALDDAMAMNNISDPQEIPLGRTINLPINSYNVEGSISKSNAIPLVYKTKPKETLFRIAKIYFKQDIKDFIERNELSGFSLDIGQELIVGYFTTQQPLEYQMEQNTSPTTDLTEENSTEEVSEKYRSVHVQRKKEGAQKEEAQKEGAQKQSEQSDTEVQFVGVVKAEEGQNPDERNEDIVDHDPSLEEGQLDAEEVQEEALPKTKTITKKGIAFWDKRGSDYENMMVLHKSAAVNSIIKIKNPVNGAEVFARVVGKIPNNAFKKDIEIVISPAVAKKIGALDSRCQVNMTYQQNI